MKEGLSAADVRLSQRLSHVAEHNTSIRRAAIVLAHSGDSPLWVGGLLLTLWLGSAPWQFVAKVDLVGIGIAAVVVQMIKLLVRRPRPPGKWGQGYRKLDPHSFPSGHAARATLLAAVSLFLGPPWWAVLLLVWAPLVALSRVVLRVHYLSDVVVGTACGLICGVALSLLLAF